MRRDKIVLTSDRTKRISTLRLRAAERPTTRKNEVTLQMFVTGLGTLITINNRIKEKGGQLRLVNINPQIYEVFAITKLDKLFKIYEDSDKACASFS